MHVICNYFHCCCHFESVTHLFCLSLLRCKHVKYLALYLYLNRHNCFYGFMNSLFFCIFCTHSAIFGAWYLLYIIFVYLLEWWWWRRVIVKIKVWQQHNSDCSNGNHSFRKLGDSGDEFSLVCDTILMMTTIFLYYAWLLNNKTKS